MRFLVIILLAACASAPLERAQTYEEDLMRCEARALDILGWPPADTEDVREGHRRLMTGYHPERAWLRLFQGEVASCMERRGYEPKNGLSG